MINHYVKENMKWPRMEI